MKKPSASSPPRASKGTSGAVTTGAVKMFRPKSDEPVAHNLVVDVRSSAPAKGQGSAGKKIVSGGVNVPKREKYPKDILFGRKGSGKSTAGKSLYTTRVGSGGAFFDPNSPANQVRPLISSPGSLVYGGADGAHRVEKLTVDFRQHASSTKVSGVQAHDAVTAGMPGRALGYIVKELGDIPSKVILDAIGISERTAHRIKAEPDKPLDMKVSDGIFKLESIRNMAIDVLGGTDAATEWLNTEAMGLEFRKPIELLSTSPGLEAVKTLLQRMKYGVYT